MLVIQPIWIHAPEALAAVTPISAASLGDQNCLQVAKDFFEQGTFDHSQSQIGSGNTSTPPATGDDEPGDVPFAQMFNLTAIKNNTLVPQSSRDHVTDVSRIKKIVALYSGATYYQNPKDSTEYVLVCQSASQLLDTRLFDPVMTIEPETLDLLTAMQDPTAKIVFANNQDLVALTGEPCPGGLVGTQSSWKEGSNPCPSFDASVDDTLISDGKWDAPRADDRILATLVYLVTPASQGGAGREHIRVKKIVSSRAANTDAPVQVDGTSTSATGSSTATPTEVTPSPTTDELKQANPHYLDPTGSAIQPDSDHVAHAVDIDEIDQARVTSKIVKERLFGNNDTDYQYQAPFPIKVAWQTPGGQAANPPPDYSKLNLLASTRLNANQAIIDMLNQYGLGDLNIDVNSADINSYGDVAMLVGQSLVEQLLGTPNGSLKGWDLSSTLNSIGRAYLEQDLGMIRGSLSEGNDYGSLTKNIGRTSVEYLMGLPQGSLKSTTGSSTDTLENLGRSYLENTVFKVSAGTLTPGDGAGTGAVGDLLERLGEGRIEKVFKLPVQSLRASDYASFRKSSFKAGLLFPEKAVPGTDDYSMADYVANGLSLAYTKFGDTNHDLYGFSESDFKEPSLQLQLSQSPDALKKFKQMVGSVVIENSVGAFKQQGVGESLLQSTKAYSVTNNSQTASTASQFTDEMLRNLPINDGTNRGDPCNPQRTVISAQIFKQTLLSCSSSDQASITADTDILASIQTVLSDTAIRNNSVFAPNDSVLAAPNPGKFSFRNADLNRAEILYYNDPRLLKQVPINAVAPLASTASDSTSSTTRSVRQAINQIPALSGDSDFMSRIAMIEKLDGEQAVSDSINLTPLLGKSNAEILQGVAGRVNLLSVHPSRDDSNPGQYVSQYSDPSYNGWLFILQDLKLRITCKIAGGNYAFDSSKEAYVCSHANGTITTPDAETLSALKQINQALDSLLTKVNTLSNAFMTVLDAGSATDSGSTMSGQSQMSSAIGLPGQLLIVNGNGQINLSSVGYSQDPMRALLMPVRDSDGNPDRNATVTDEDNYLQQIGRLYAAKQFSDDAVTQRTVATQLSATSKTFDEAFANFAKLGINDEPLKEKGLDEGDFSRIFQLGLGDQVYERIGKEEMLRVFYDKSGIGAKITSSQQYSGLLKQINQLSQKYSFYSDRINSIQDKTDTLTQDAQDLADSVNSDYASASKSLKAASSQLNELNKASAATNKGDAAKNLNDNVKNLQKVARNYEPLIKAIRDQYESIQTKDPKNPYLSQIAKVEADAEDLNHVLQELAAGKELPRSDSDSNTSVKGAGGQFGAVNAKSNACLQPQDALNILKAGNKSKGTTIKVDTKQIGKDLTSYGEYVGACQLDQGLGLPNGSLYTWYELGQFSYPADGSPAGDGVPSWTKGTWNADSLKLAVGIADANQNQKTAISKDQVQAMPQAKAKALAAQGEKILKATAMAKLLGLVPGLKTLAKSVGLNDQDLANLLQGNSRAVLSKVGGSAIDKALSLPTGTGLQLISPTCHNNNGEVAACSNDPKQPGTDPNLMRSQVLAQAGLQAIGVSIPDFPKYFNLSAGGNLAANWGNARVTQDLGIAPNSFSGKITDPKSPLITLNEQNNDPNDQAALESAFGLRHPLAGQLNSLTKSLLQIESGSSNAQVTYLDLINQPVTDFTKKETLDLLANDPTGTYWQTNADKGTGPLNDAAAALADHDQAALYGPSGLVTTLWKTVGSTDYYDPQYDKTDKRIEARKAIADALLTANPDKLKTLTDNDYKSDEIPAGLIPDSDALLREFFDYYLASVSRLQRTVTGLDQQYSLKNGTFQQFLTGQITAEDITQTIGKNDTVNHVIGDKINQYIDESAPSWLKDANTTLRALTKGQCGTSKGLGDLLAGMVSTTKNSCATFSGLGDISGTDLLYSDSFKDFRTVLFDKYLSSTLSAKLESDLRLQPDTFRNIVIDPRKGPQILLGQGIEMMTDQIFGTAAENADSPLRSDLRDAFLAGFYNADTHEYHIDFKSGVAKKKLSDDVNAQIDLAIRRTSQKYLGIEITRADVNRIVAGDTRYFGYIGLQYAVNAVNASLISDPKTANDPNLKYFLISLDDVRASMGITNSTPEEKANIQVAAEEQYQIDTVNAASGLASADGSSAGEGASILDGDSFKNTLQNQYGDNAPEAIRQQMASVDATAVDDAAKQKQDAAQQSLKYKLFDAAAFKADQNIPPGFAKSMFSGTDVDKATSITEYTFNSLAKSSSEFSQLVRSLGVSPADLAKFSAAFTDALTSDSVNRQAKLEALWNTNGQLITNIDTGLTSYFANNILHTSLANVPPGMFKGIYIWAEHGFKPSEFHKNYDTFDKDGKKNGSVNALGAVLESYARSVIYSWGDKELGLKPGTIANVVTIYNGLHTLYELGRAGKTLKDAQYAQAANLVFEEIKDLVLSSFSQQLQALDTSIGLPPGTMSQIVGIGLTALAMYFHLIAWNPGTIYVAVAILLLTLIFGVVRVVVTIRGTADGYYPFHNYGRGEAGKTPQYAEYHPANDPTIGEFDPNNQASYREGLQNAARAKVRGLLTDLLNMPTSSFVKINNLEPNSMWISQVFTWGDSTYNPMSDATINTLVSQPAPWSTPAGYGYGSINDRCDVSLDDMSSTGLTCKNKPDWLSGYFANPNPAQAAYVLLRW